MLSQVEWRSLMRIESRFLADSESLGFLGLVNATLRVRTEIEHGGRWWWKWERHYVIVEVLLP